jgi:hypothetical protein
MDGFYLPGRWYGERRFLDKLAVALPASCGWNLLALDMLQCETAQDHCMTLSIPEAPRYTNTLRRTSNRAGQ